MMTSTMVALRSTFDPEFDVLDGSAEAITSVDGLHVRPLDVRLSRHWCRLREYLPFRDKFHRANQSASPLFTAHSAASRVPALTELEVGLSVANKLSR